MKIKKKIQIKTNDGSIIFKGKSLEIPIKRKAIIDKSIEVFDDDDPCIIHESYVIKLFVKELFHLIPSGVTEFALSEIKEQVDFLNLDTSNCILIIER